VTAGISVLWCTGVALVLQWLMEPHAFWRLVAAGLLFGIFGLIPVLLASLPATRRATLLGSLSRHPGR
jgi:hypothetical protein